MDTNSNGNGRVALITGGGSGIGRSAAIELAETGFTVAIAGRRKDALEATAAKCAKGSIVPMSADVGNRDSVETLFNRIQSELGRLDVLFNNAGISAPPETVDKLSIDDWQKCVDINLTGSFLCARLAFGMMRNQSPQGGRIINNGSVSAYSPRPFSAPYTATKHAIGGLTKCLSLDGRPYNIACSQIDIGNAETAIAAKFKTGVPQASGEIKTEPTFDVSRCGEAVAYIASLPLNINIQFMTIMATNMPYIGRG